MNPYSELGIGKTAGRDEIKHAYRKRAKKAHPDAGGDAKAFSRLQIAYDTLSDEERRAKYDETGTIEDKPVDNVMAQAMNIVSMAVETILNACEQRGMDTISVDIIADAKTAVRGNLSELESQEAALRKRLSGMKRVSGKFKVKAGKQDFITALVQNRMRQIQEGVDKAARDKIPCKKALEILSDYTFNWENDGMAGGSPPRAQFMTQWA